MLSLRLPRNITQGSADPCAIPVVLVKQCLPCRALLRFLPALSLWSAIAHRFTAHSTIRLPSSELTVFRRRKAFLLCKNPCGGTAVGMGYPPQSGMHRPRKEISRGNLLCAASGLPNLSCPRRLSAQKYVTTPDWENLCIGQPRGARGTAVPLFREESRGTPSKGFLWATSSRRLDTALLFADKKRGVETYQAGRALPVNPWSSDHRKSKPRSIAPGLLRYSTVTLFARFLGLSISQPLCSAI